MAGEREAVGAAKGMEGVDGAEEADVVGEGGDEWPSAKHKTD